jgi:hypothetical protein
VSMTGRAPLTGVPVRYPLRRAAVIVKISNTPDAHPHRGIGNADIVFVEAITTATTRLAAVFHSQLPAQVGPVRSLRPMDAPLLGPTRGVLGSTMGDGWVVKYLDKVAALKNLGTMRVPRGTYRIDRRRRAPNHAFAQPARLLALSGRRTPPPPYFQYAPDTPRSTAMRTGRRVNKVIVGYGGSATTTWTYEPRSWRWLRSERRGPHRLEGGRQVAANNVIVLTAGRDRSFTQARWMTIPKVVNASGTLRLYSGSKMVWGRWHKRGVNEPFRFTTLDGKPLLLRPGSTWVECAFTDTPIKTG